MRVSFYCSARNSRPSSTGAKAFVLPASCLTHTEMKISSPSRRRRLASLTALVFALSLAYSPADAAERLIFAPENVLAEPAKNPAWSELFAELGKSNNRYSRFEESRYFPFREKPIVMQGEIRIVPDRGLSLSYAGSKPHVVIVDESGVMMRDGRGRERSAPNDNQARGVTSALSNILRFDLSALEKEFVVHGIRDGDDWTLGFAPRDPNLTKSLGTVIVHGKKNTLGRIEMVKSPKQRIEIVISESKDDVTFTPDVLQRFFR